MKRLIIAFIVVLSCALVSCSESLVRVKPFEREYFAEDKMYFVPAGKRSDFEEHVHGIREGSVGGTAGIQGGCACR